jgi:hypothetical protein
METAAIDRYLPTLAPLGRSLLRPVGLVVQRLKLTRLSLRVLMALVLVIGGGLGWVGRGARGQRDAVAAITSLKGSVSYDIEWPMATPNPYRRNSWSPMQFYDGQIHQHEWLKWLVSRVGIDYFGNVVEVRLMPRRAKDKLKADDTTMVHIGRLRWLNGLSLYHTSVTDHGLAQLERLTELRELDLRNTRVSDAGLAHLKGLHDLRTLLVEGTNVTDAGVADLERALPLLQVIR